MFSKFLPTQIFDNIYAITPEWLREQGVAALILDIDNTLVTTWLDAMHAAGIKTAFVSNNHERRVDGFCAGMDCYHHADSGKPSTKYLREAMAHMGSGVHNTAAVGDQLFTDVWAATRAGIRAYLVPPIKDKRTLFFRAKRLLEKPFLRLYFKRKGTTK